MQCEWIRKIDPEKWTYDLAPIYAYNILYENINNYYSSIPADDFVY